MWLLVLFSSSGYRFCLIIFQQCIFDGLDQLETFMRIQNQKFYTKTLQKKLSLKSWQVWYLVLIVMILKVTFVTFQKKSVLVIFFRILCRQSRCGPKVKIRSYLYLYWACDVEYEVSRVKGETQRLLQMNRQSVAVVDSPVDLSDFMCWHLRDSNYYKE